MNGANENGCYQTDAQLETLSKSQVDEKANACGYLKELHSSGTPA